jgi:AraC-like DNA-binding protein
LESAVKPDLEVVQIGREESFKAWSHGYPFRTVRWHFHPEYELHLITHTFGDYFVGDFIGQFGPGNLVLTGPNLPHNWITDLPEGTSIPNFCLVLQFTDEFIRSVMAALPELGSFGAVLAESQRGVQFTDRLGTVVEPLFKEIIALQGALRISRFMELVHLLTSARERKVLAGPTYATDLSTLMSGSMNRVLHYIAENLTLIGREEELASIAGMNPAAFSRSFSRHTGMTPIRYLARLRIDLACSLLMSSSDRPITEIAFDVGFNNLSNFNRQFLALKGMPPSRFRTFHLSSRGASRTLDGPQKKSEPREGPSRERGFSPYP